MNGEDGRTKPNKANWVNSSRIREMHEEFIKQSQTAYPAYFQSLAAHFRPFLGKMNARDQCTDQ
jgi:hypothetical protein